MPNHWPHNPAVQHFLLENPWPVLVCFAVFSLIFVWHYLQKRKRPLLFLAILCASVAGSVLLLASLITTARERLISLNTQLVLAVAPDTNIPTLQRLFAPTISFQITQSVVQSQEVQPLLDLIQRVTRKYRLHNISLPANDARSSPLTPGSNLLESYFQVRLTVTANDEGPFSGSDTTVTTDWLCQWSPQPDGSYQIVTLRWLKFNNNEPASSLLP